MLYLDIILQCGYYLFRFEYIIFYYYLIILSRRIRYENVSVKNKG